MSHDIAYTLQSLGMVRKSNTGDAVVVIDWEVVNSHMERRSKNKNRIEIDPECLRWTPLISPIVTKQLNDVNIFDNLFRNGWEENDWSYFNINHDYRRNRKQAKVVIRKQTKKSKNVRNRSVKRRRRKYLKNTKPRSHHRRPSWPAEVPVKNAKLRWPRPISKKIRRRSWKDGLLGVILL